jgi:elongation factor Ts
MTGWFKERCLLEQPYVRDEKRSVADLLGSAEVARFAQVVIGS